MKVKGLDQWQLGSTIQNPQILYLLRLSILRVACHDLNLSVCWLAHRALYLTTVVIGQLSCRSVVLPVYLTHQLCTLSICITGWLTVSICLSNSGPTILEWQVKLSTVPLSLNVQSCFHPSSCLAG